MTEFPRPDLPIEEKFKKDEFGVYIYAKNAIDFAIQDHYQTRMLHIKKMNELYRKFNGTFVGYAARYLTSAYGAKSAAEKYIDYRIPRPKLEKLVGEFVERPINSTVFTVNINAQMKKLDNYYRVLALFHEQEAIQKIRDEHGEEAVMDGMPIPTEAQVKGFWESKNSKTKNEETMQYLVDNFVKVNRDFLFQLSNTYRDVLISSECHAKVTINHLGKVCYEEIDPRDAIFLENDRDHFCNTSPYRGRKRRQFLHQIIEEYQLDKKQIDMLIAEAGGGDEMAYEDSYDRNYNIEGKRNMAFWVYTIQWKSFDPIITKVNPIKNNRLATEPAYADIPADKYAANKSEFDKDVSKGKYQIETKYKETLWEVTRIGRTMYINGGPKSNIIGSFDKPFGTKFEYVSYLSQTINGMRISLLEMMDALSEQYNIVRFMINRELTKMKGMSFTYDRAFLPKGETMKSVMKKLINDGILDYDSSEDGNISGETKEGKDAFRAVDLGVSASFQTLVMLAQNIENTLETVSGVANQRTGEIKASETATNAQSAITSSKTMTEPINIGFDTFISNVITLVMEQSKIASLVNPEWGETVVGADGLKFIEISADISTDDFGNYLQDYRKEKQVRDRSVALAEQAINSGELKVEDLMEAEMEETIAGAIQVLRSGTQRIQQIASQQAEAEQKMKQEEMANAVKMAQEDREDKQAAKINEIVTKGKVDGALIAQEAANQNILERTKTEKKNK